MAEPKKRTNKSKRGMRRMHDKVSYPSVSVCDKCHEIKESHKVCYSCGTYQGEQVIVKKEKIKE